MTTQTWMAPRAAYLLTAAMADNSEHDEVIAATDSMRHEWSGYSEDQQGEILIALGAQTRFSLRMLRDKLSVQIEMDWGEVARLVCAQALALAHELVTSEEGPWVMPECAHCREVIGNGLCAVQIQAYRMLGFSPARVAEICRQSAEDARHAAGTPPVTCPP